MKQFFLCMEHSRLYLQVITFQSHIVNTYAAESIGLRDVYKVIHNRQTVGDNYTVTAGSLV